MIRMFIIRIILDYLLFNKYVLSISYVIDMEPVLGRFEKNKNQIITKINVIVGE